MTITSQAKWPVILIATLVALALAALGFPSGASASSGGVRGVDAELDNGTLNVNGGDRPNAVTLRLKEGDSTRIQVDAGDNGSADFTFARRDVHAISVRMGNGRDSVLIDDANGAVTDAIPTTIAGGNGDDTLLGGQGIETFSGGNGHDFVDGGRGNDHADLGRGDDTFQWDPGEGSDAIEGESGRDTMLFNGAPGDETVTMTANGPRLIFLRQPGNVTMNTRGVEVVDFNALGGKDNITVNDLSGTDVTQTNLDLAGELGGNAPDGAADSVTVNGTDGADHVNVLGNGSGADVSGLATAVSVKHADSNDPKDTLSVNTLPGADNVHVAGVAGVLDVLVNGLPV
jgi:Ca2+-binding RTX toxin-like protein